jgi:hypothetical protein
MSQDVETEFGELADKLTEWTVQMMANRLEAVMQAVNTFDVNACRATFMGIFAEHRQQTKVSKD